MLKITCTGDMVHCKLEGNAEELIQELVMINISVMNRIVDNLQLKEDKSEMMAKLQMADTVNKCVKSGLKIKDLEKVLNKPKTVSDLVNEQRLNKAKTVASIVKNKMGIDLDDLQLQIISMQELLDKWLPIMDEHILSDVEMTVMQREVHEAGLTMEDFINKLIDIKVGNKEEK